MTQPNVEQYWCMDCGHANCALHTLDVAHLERAVAERRATAQAAMDEAHRIQAHLDRLAAIALPYVCVKCGRVLVGGKCPIATALAHDSVVCP